MPQTEPGPEPAAPWRIGVDVGGTFTDMVLRDAGGALFVFKVPSVSEDPSRGVHDALARAADELGLTVETLLEQCELFVHGSTVATNTILEKKGARVGLLTSAGFRDSLEVRRGIRENQWDHRAPFPEVLVPRYLRLPVRGRIDKDGRELEPLVATEVAAAYETLEAEGVESIAICLLNSYRNPAHEEAAAAALRGIGDDAWLSVSNRIAPIMGEYERGSTTVVNAYIAPKVVGYLQALDIELRRLGLPRPLLLLQSNGGAISVDQVRERPVNLVLSGPAAGVGALNLCRRHSGNDDLISMEIGGTSCDVMLMGKGAVSVSDELIIDGYHLATPSVDIHTVGAGGGTIAWVDEAGLLHVGPRGAGADPGPACYGLGGSEPTVTDAYMVLGRLRPGPYAGGSVVLDRRLARAAVEARIANPLGIDAEAAAAGILRLLEQNLLHAVERISIERGHNPQRFTLVASGGAGPMHGARVARMLGCQRVYVPRQAGAFCALGMLYSDVRRDYLQVFFGDLDRLDHDDIEAGFRVLCQRAASELAEEGFAPEASRIAREIDLRYRGQLWSIGVGVDEGRLDPVAVRRAFEAEHDKRFGHIQPDGTLEVTALRVTGRGLLDRTEPAAAAVASAPPEPIGEADIFAAARAGRVAMPIYRGRDLAPGHAFDGPALIEELTTTVFVPPGDRVEIDTADNIVLHIASGEI